MIQIILKPTNSEIKKTLKRLNAFFPGEYDYLYSDLDIEGFHHIYSREDNADVKVSMAATPNWMAPVTRFRLFSPLDALLIEGTSKDAERVFRSYTSIHKDINAKVVDMVKNKDVYIYEKDNKYRPFQKVK